MVMTIVVNINERNDYEHINDKPWIEEA